MAAHRHGIDEAILPKDNQKDLPDIPEQIRNVMKLHFVENMDEVLKIALERELIALPMTTGPTAVDVAVSPIEDRAH
jgi:ATP-dependent Lon protease